MKKLTRVERKRRRNKIILRMILLIALLSISAFYVTKSETFNIKKINVEGNSILSEEMIINSSRIFPGENILKTSMKESEEYIKHLPYIKDAQAKRKFPSTVNIHVSEREVLFQIKSLSSYVLLDKEGYALEIIDHRREDTPAFTGFNIEDLELGKDITSSEEGKSLADFFNDEDLINIVKQFKTLDYVDGEINIDLFNGIGVAFGPLNNVKYKLKYMQELLIDIEKKQIATKMIIMNKGENAIIVTE